MRRVNQKRENNPIATSNICTTRDAQKIMGTKSLSSTVNILHWAKIPFCMCGTGFIWDKTAIEKFVSVVFNNTTAN